MAAKVGVKAIRYINSRLLFVADLLANQFGTVTINDWHWGGNFKESGLRVVGDEYYSSTSDHSYGNALDLKFKGVSAAQVRKYIEAYPNQFPYITFIEEGKDVTWLHISVSNVSETFDVQGQDAIVFWSVDTGAHRIVARTRLNTSPEIGG